MEPRIQYAKTADGVSIAFGTLGKGPALVHVMAVESQMQAQWEAPEFRRWDERLAEKRMVVKYDSRGTGLSQRDVTDFSPEAQPPPLPRCLHLAALSHRLRQCSMAARADGQHLASPGGSALGSPFEDGQGEVHGGCAATEGAGRHKGHSSLRQP
jgi:hypothetical protein